MIRRVNPFEKDGMVSYLNSYGAACELMVACLEGMPTFHLANSIRYDRGGRAPSQEREFVEIPQIQASFDTEGRVDGVVVSISLPEFGDVLDYETYLVAQADSGPGYRSLLSACSFRERVEIVTIDAKHRQWLAGLRSSDLAAIHHWEVFVFEGGRTAADSSLYRATSEADMTAVSALARGLPIERDPCRALWFETCGLPYLNFTVRTGGEGSVLLGLRRYSSRSWEIHYIMAPEGDQGAVEFALRSVLADPRIKSVRIIWRMRKEERDAYEAAATGAGFAHVSSEEHFHISLDEEALRLRLADPSDVEDN